jgi:ribonucleoside-diphosphate reductase alpha chain
MGNGSAADQAQPKTMAVEEAWDRLDSYLTTTRYSVRDPKTFEPLEPNYQSIVAGRLVPKLGTLRDPLEGGGLMEELFQGLRQRHLIPASPLLMSFGNPHTRRPGYFSCYPLGAVGDSLEEIEATRRKMRTIYMAGGGAGIDISKLRPKGTPVDNGQGIASGPVGFLPDFDAVTGTTNQGGRRRGALLVQMDWDHPDIVSFIEAKNFNGKLNKFMETLPPAERPTQSPCLSNMNISVNVFGDFWKRDDLIDLVAGNMWETGDPGLLFIDNMLRYSPLRAEDEPRYSNPCGEYLASAGTACNLITVNAARLARQAHDRLRAGGLDPEGSPAQWAREFGGAFFPLLSRAAGLACYLGNLILGFDEGYPLDEIRERTQAMKPVGVGLSGFHTALLLSSWGRDAYGSPEAVAFARATQASLTLGTLSMSAAFARKTGHVYENPGYWKAHLAELGDTLSGLGLDEGLGAALGDLGRLVEERGGFYNCLTTSQAPTGSVSAFLRNIDTGIEPFFSLAVDRRVLDPKEGWVGFTLRPQELSDLLDLHPAFRERAEAQTALRLRPEDQLGMLAAFQIHNHTGVSKTINLPSTATKEEVRALISKSRDMRLKGFTVYRDGSLTGVLSVAGAKKAEAREGGGEFDDETMDRDVGDDRPGRIFRARSSSLNAHITLSHDSQNNIREVFVSAGDVGADINAIFTAFGMILSVALRRAPFLFEPLVRVLLKVRMDQRVVIRTKMSEDPIVGNSLPQAIGLLMRQRKEFLDKGSPVPVPHDDGAFDICPECHKLSFKREGCCRKCLNCGYSTC